MDPRFANAGGLPVMSGNGAQEVPGNYHHRRHHRRHKNKGRHNESPLSRDESINKFDMVNTKIFNRVKLLSLNLN